MYRIQTTTDKFELYELCDEAGYSSIKVCPTRGGIVTSFTVEGQELLYLDKETFYDENANIRGGNPILFPICGQLKDGHYTLNGKTYTMKNHGLARIKPWEVVSTKAESEQASLTIRLHSDEETKQSYPFDFELLFEYVLRGNQLIINQKYANLSSQPMPMYAGFHPYFATVEKNLAYESDATTVLDYNDMKEKPYEGHVDLTALKESVALLDPKKRSIAFHPPELDKKITLSYGDEFTNVQIWSVQGKDFVCVEPWMARTYAMNTGEGLIHVDPNGSLETFLAIQYGE